MARKKKAAVTVGPSAQPTQAKFDAEREKEYQLRDDADQIKRYAALRADKGRHSRAIARIRKENTQIDQFAGSAPRTPKRVAPREAARA